MTGSKKVAFLCHPYHRGGVTRWMADAAIAMAGEGHDVSFVTVEPAKPFHSAKGRETMVQLLQKIPNKVKLIAEKAGYEFELGTPEYRAYIYRRLLQKLAPGTIIVLSDDAVVWEAATSLNPSYFIAGVLHADEELYYRLAARYYRQVHAMVCVSKRVCDTVKKRVPDLDDSSLFTIPCGINLPVLKNTNLGDTLQLIYVGRVSNYQKRATDLVKVVELMVQKRCKFRMDVIGDGDARTGMEQQSKEKGLSDLITFRGWLSQDEVARYLSAADVLVLTSDFEGTPVAMMEALANGCGMAGTRVSGIEDYEFHPLAADCFGVFEVGNIEDAVSAVMKVAAVPRAVRRVAARKLAETEFSMRVCLDRYYQVFSQENNEWASPVAPKLGLASLLKSKALAVTRSLKLRLSRKA